VDTKIAFWEGFLGWCLLHVSVSSGASLGNIARPALFRYSRVDTRIAVVEMRGCGKVKGGNIQAIAYNFHRDLGA
jgi:hypothetical protein